MALEPLKGLDDLEGLELYREGILSSRKGALKLFACFLFALVLLLPFLNQAFHIDDPFLLYGAEGFWKEPWRPYDMKVLWYDNPAPLFEVFYNPPFLPALGALLVKAFGSSERALHLCFIPFALLSCLGMYLLALRFTSFPYMATLLFVSIPSFQVMTHTLMADVPHLSFFLLSLSFFIYGVDKENKALLCLSSVFITLAFLTKYTSLTLLPLLLCYSLVQKKPLMKCLSIFIFPMLIFGLWCGYTYLFYGKVHLIPAAQTWSFDLHQIVIRLLSLFSQVGGTTLFPLALIVAAIWRKNSLTLYLFLWASLGFWIRYTYGYTLLQSLLFCLFVSSGVMAFFMYFQGKQESDDVFLGLWLMGIGLTCLLFFFYGASRFILPLTPALVLLFVRRAERFQRLTTPFLVITLLFTTGTSMLLSLADYEYAGVYREFVRDFSSRQKEGDEQVWFVGHWGFQYYMEHEGYKALATEDNSPKDGDVIVKAPLPWPQPFHPQVEKALGNREEIFYRGRWPIRTWSPQAKAGFYSTGDWAFLPFSFSSEPLEVFEIYTILEPEPTR